MSSNQLARVRSKQGVKAALQGEHVDAHLRELVAALQASNQALEAQNAELRAIADEKGALIDGLLGDLRAQIDTDAQLEKAVRQHFTRIPFNEETLDALVQVIRSTAESTAFHLGPAIRADASSRQARLKNAGARIRVQGEWELAKRKGGESKRAFADRMSQSLKVDSNYQNPRTGRAGLTISAKQISEVWLKGK
jgi:hypothetical protein